MARLSRLTPQLYHARQRRLGRRNLLREPWSEDLQEAEWSAVNGASVNGAEALSLAAQVDSGVELVLDDQVDVRKAYILGREPGHRFVLSAILELVQMNTGAEPMPVLLGYEEAAEGLTSVSTDLTVAGGAVLAEVPFKVLETVATGGSAGAVVVRTGDSAKAADILVRGLVLTRTFP